MNEDFVDVEGDGGSSALAETLLQSVCHLSNSSSYHKVDWVDSGAHVNNLSECRAQREIFEKSKCNSGSLSSDPVGIEHVSSDAKFFSNLQTSLILDLPHSKPMPSSPHSLGSWEQRTSPSKNLSAAASENSLEEETASRHCRRKEDKDVCQPCSPSQQKIHSISRPNTGSTNFLIEEILKPTFGSSSKSNRSKEFICSRSKKRDFQSPLEMAATNIKTRTGNDQGLSRETQFTSGVTRGVIEGGRSKTVCEEEQTQPIKRRKPSQLDALVNYTYKNLNISKTEHENSGRNFENFPQNLRGNSEKSISGGPYCGQFVANEPLGYPLVKLPSANQMLISSRDQTSDNSSNCSSHTSDDGGVVSGESSNNCSIRGLSTTSATKCIPPSQQLPAWVYCTRYSDRPSSGPRSRKSRGVRGGHQRADSSSDDKRPRTAFTVDQIQALKREFSANQYLSEDRRHSLAIKLNLNETQIKIWFQNKRAKLKKASGIRNQLAIELTAQGLYNHTSNNYSNNNNSNNHSPSSVVTPTTASSGACASS